MGECDQVGAVWEDRVWIAFRRTHFFFKRNKRSMRFRDQFRISRFCLSFCVSSISFI